MTKARDISSLIGSSGQIDNTKITLDVNEIPSLDATKIHDGSVSNTEFSYIGSLVSDAQTQINTKASTGKSIAMAIVFGG
jgi:hypothetical protein